MRHQDNTNAAAAVFISMPEAAQYDSNLRFYKDALQQSLAYLRREFPGRTSGPVVLVGQGERMRNLLRAGVDPKIRASAMVLQSPVMAREYRQYEWVEVLDLIQPEQQLLITLGQPEAVNPDYDGDVSRDAEALAQRLRAQDIKVEIERSSGGFGWGRWRYELPTILQFANRL